MNSKTIIKPAESPAAIGPYNHAVRVGDLLFCSGQIPLNAERPESKFLSVLWLWI